MATTRLASKTAGRDRHDSHRLMSHAMTGDRIKGEAI